MSTHSPHTSTLEIKSDTYESIDDLFSKYIKEVSVFKTFSNSSLDSLKHEAKKLKKSSSLGYKDALNKVAIARGFKSFKDCLKQWSYWQSLPPIYIHISKNTQLSYRKDVFSRLPQDGKSKSMKELMRDTSINRFNVQESISKKGIPIPELDNYKLGIKLLNDIEKEEFFNRYKDLQSIRRIDREKDFIFKFIHYKLDPAEEKKIRDDIAKSIKKDGYRFYETNATYQITDLIDQQLYALLNTEVYTENTYVDESYSINPDGYIANNTYYNAVGLHDDIFDQFAPIVDSDY